MPCAISSPKTLHNQAQLFFTSLKTESSYRYVIIDDVLLGELKRWQAQQVKSKKLIGGTYVYVYREDDGHIERRSKALPAPDDEKVSLVCVRDDGRIILKSHFTKVTATEGLSAHSFRHTVKFIKSTPHS